MEKYNAQQFADIADNLRDSIQDFLKYPTHYATDVIVGICEETREILLDSPNKISSECKQFSIADFILINEQGLYEPDLKIIYGEKTC